MQINEYQSFSDAEQMQVLMVSADACARELMDLVQKRFPEGSTLRYQSQFMEQPNKGTVKRVEWTNRKPHLVIFDHYHGFELPILLEHVCHENNA